jgi:hypothetical protein
MLQTPYPRRLPAFLREQKRDTRVRYFYVAQRHDHPFSQFDIVERFVWFLDSGRLGAIAW